MSLLDLWFAFPAPSREQKNVKQPSIIGLKGMEYNGRRVKEGFVTIFIGAGLETRDSGFFTGGDDLAWRRIVVFRVPKSQLQLRMEGGEFFHFTRLPRPWYF